jgi:CheY-like chemotaxis protein
VARNGEESLSMVDDHDFDLVLMDIRMPGISGTTAAREIKERSSVRGITLPVIAVSAAMSSDNLDTIYGSGIDDYIPKPFEEKLLVRTILSVITHKGQPVYDLSPLKQASGGNMKFFREMLDLFLEDTSGGLELLDGYLQDKDWAKAADIAHKISSPCRHLKADRLYGLLKEIEQDLRTPGNPLPVADLLSRARKEFELIRNDITNGKHLK